MKKSGLMICMRMALATGICFVAASLVMGEQPSPPTSGMALLSIPSLPNAHRLHAKVISGGQPDGDAGFQALHDLGVRTVISVDGAKPELALAEKYGLRYVHLPHGYDGISGQRSLELAKAVHDLPGPIYIHCHHGKHRSPAAAVVACIGAGYLDHQVGLEVLRLAGTSPDYQGLYKVVASTGRCDELDAVVVDYREAVEVPPLATAMVQIERTFDNLRLIEAAGWQSPAKHKDLTPQHEALLLREHYTELMRTEEVLARTSAFRELLKSSIANVRLLEEQLRRQPKNATEDDLSKRRSESLAVIHHDCRHCHRAHRD
ncbi:MAG: hypothetical protein KDB11_17730 [Planctomycetales bacterium]|nr:hypothetical protein [Planctomycetales bacterium]